MTIELHRGDLPAGLKLGPVVAVDTETMGLNPVRDRLCLVQLSQGDGVCHLVQIAKPARRPARDRPPSQGAARRIRKVLKLFHFARFDLSALKVNLDVDCAPVYCTKIAAKLVRTFTDRHGLKDLCKELLGIDLSKQQQSSDWGAETLSQDQLKYAAADVLYLHQLKDKLDPILDAGRAPRTGGGLLRLPADAGRPGSAGLGSARYFRALTPGRRPWVEFLRCCAKAWPIPGSAGGGTSLDLPGVRRYGPAVLMDCRRRLRRGH